jgi:hypothetical protein
MPASEAPSVGYCYECCSRTDPRGPGWWRGWFTDLWWVLRVGRVATAKRPGGGLLAASMPEHVGVDRGWNARAFT